MNERRICGNRSTERCGHAALHDGHAGSEGNQNMGIVAWIVLGAIAGFLANSIAGGHDGLVRTVLLGMVGCLLGGFAATRIFHRRSVNGINLESIAMAIAGAVVVMLAWRAITPRRGRWLGF